VHTTRADAISLSLTVRAKPRRLHGLRKPQGLHHITPVAADRQTSIDFWGAVLEMPLVFEQAQPPNASESHLYFDPGGGRLITVFTNEERTWRRGPD